ncbi:hypothetical protein HYFRA_00001308 [Hymenoscyphus fraxineus]|uniref:Uncharacterized protein n=1 Tax=Hymenoscyphus fraxineus TaxID=746836 RepID=A0A9N9L371_9HELO|nr:hypothetical protein HYFRA_00001308 [Hymenoscyphus fraxineus]
MASFSRGLRSGATRNNFLCSSCRQFSTTSTAQSGHSRWSKIKHDKGVTDHRRSKANQLLSDEIAFASRMGGPDPNGNYKLATALVNAKKGGFPKANIEAAIARGQGKSATGAILEYVTLEAIVPPQIAMIIEAETERAKRTLEDLRYYVKKAGGAATPTTYLFQKKGRVSFEAHESLGVDEVLDEAIEAGAEDVETDEDGGIVLWTEPNKTTSAAQSLEKSLGLKAQGSKILWDPNEDTKVPLDAESTKPFLDFVNLMREQQYVQAVYANVAQGSLTDEEWEDVQSKLDS